METEHNKHPSSLEIVETRDAYDDKRLDRLNSRDIIDAVQFDTEFKDTFGFAWIDEEVRNPLADALEQLLVELEDAGATIPGIVVRVLKVVMKGHPRGFGRYYSGTDLWPRPSQVVQKEIDERLPDALNWLRFELKEALEEERRDGQA